MKYEEFNYYISRLKEVQDFDNELGELSRKYSNLLYDNYLVPVVLADDYIRLLEIVLGIILFSLGFIIVFFFVLYLIGYAWLIEPKKSHLRNTENKAMIEFYMN